MKATISSGDRLIDLTSCESTMGISVNGKYYIIDSVGNVSINGSTMEKVADRVDRELAINKKINELTKLLRALTVGISRMQGIVTTIEDFDIE